MNPDVARTPDDVTVEFLDRVISRPTARIVGAVSRPFGTGQIATTLRTTLQWSTDDPDLPSHVIVKLAGIDPGQREAARSRATFRREVGFYRELAPRLAVPIPHHLHAADDPATTSMTIILDEVAGRPGDQLGGCGAEDAEAIVESAIELHSPFWGRSHELESLDWLAPDGHDAAVVRGNRYRQLLASFGEQYRTRLSSDVHATAIRLGDLIERVTTRRRAPTCLTHRDFRLDNMIFVDRGEATSAVIVDWQTVGIGSGPADLAFALGSGLPTEVRHNLEMTLLDRYVDGLRMRQRPVSHDDVEHDYRIGAAEGLVMAVIASQVVGHTVRGDEMFAVMAELHARQMRDLGTLDLLI